MTIPNLITIFRLILVPVVIVMIAQERWLAAFVLFVVAGVSDAIDGYIARRFNMRSEFGAVIDPLADKALLMSIYVTLAIGGVIPGWLAILVVSRDVMMLLAIGVSALMHRPLSIKPLMIGKVNTAAQIGFAALVLSTRALGVDPAFVSEALMVLIAALTVASGGAYLAGWLRLMTAEPPE